MRTQAIILKKIPVREYDNFVTCYTKHAGKQIYQAKSIRRHTSKQAGHLDILNWVDFLLVHPKSSPEEQIVNGSPRFGEAGYSIITQAYSLRTYSNLKSSLPAMAAAFFLLESLDKLVFEGETDEKLWHFFLNQLDQLDGLAFQKNLKWPVVIKSIHKELLSILGYDAKTSLEDLAGRHFFSLQFVKKVIG